MTPAKRWKGSTGGGWTGQMLLLVLFRLGLLRFSYVFMAAIVPFYMIFNRKGFNAIYSYFRLRLGYSRAKAFRKTYRNHYLFGQVILDRFAVFAGKRNLFSVEVIGEEYFTKLSNGTTGFVMANSHVGNAEIGGYLLKAKAKKVNVLVYHGETKVVKANRQRILEENNIALIPVQNDMSHIFFINSALRNGEILSVFCDRTYLTDERSNKIRHCNFMGAKAAFPIGTFELAVRFKMEMIALFAVKKSARKYVIYVCPLSIEPSATTKEEKVMMYLDKYVTELETVLSQYPEQWFNYYDFWDLSPE
ncbi:MAG: lipid A biosynthesis (KDO)2-(lauroyl)-lipid IVA acyltransferase [Bacteroidales bacterium]|jgi:predicted LPLAT superfamily acyltransferase|nr:lipid A biosynthesis (KDO)2-(lauroyl)-lipid IVA acyltransferase [Bacteroidales bacterium]